MKSRMQSMMNSSTLISSMPMLMPASSGMESAGMASREAGERGARIRKRVDADAEPGDTIAAGDADKAEEKDDGTWLAGKCERRSRNRPP